MNYRIIKNKFLLLLILIIIGYSILLCNFSFSEFARYKKGFDWKLMQYQLEQINYAGFTDYFGMHRAFITYLYQPFYAMFDRSAVFVFLAQIIISAFIAVYIYLIGKLLIKRESTALLLAVFYLCYYHQFEFILRDGYADNICFIIPAVYYFLKKKYKAGYLFIFLLGIIREDCWLIGLTGASVLYLQKEYLRAVGLAFFLVLTVFFNMLFLQPYFNSYILKYAEYSHNPNIIVQNDLELDKAKDYSFSVYSTFGKDVKDIITNSARHPFLILSRLFSVENANLINSLFKHIFYFPVIFGYSIFVFFIPYLYVFLSEYDSSLRAFSHFPLIAPGVILCFIYSVYFLERFYIKIGSKTITQKKNAARLINLIIIAVILWQIPYIYKTLKNHQRFYTTTQYIDIFRDLSNSKNEIINLKHTILKSKRNPVIVVSERLHYFIRDTDNTFNLWFNTFIIENDTIFIEHINKRFPVDYFFMDASLDYGKGWWEKRYNMFKRCLESGAYKITYWKYPLIIIEKNNGVSMFSDNPINNADFLKYYRYQSSHDKF